LGDGSSSEKAESEETGKHGGDSCALSCSHVTGHDKAIRDHGTIAIPNRAAPPLQREALSTLPNELKKGTQAP
jgi:hypothetical protein